MFITISADLSDHQVLFFSFYYYYAYWLQNCIFLKLVCWHFITTLIFGEIAHNSQQHYLNTSPLEMFIREFLASMLCASMLCITNFIPLHRNYSENSMKAPLQSVQLLQIKIRVTPLCMCDQWKTSMSYPPFPAIHAHCLHLKQRIT